MITIVFILSSISYTCSRTGSRDPMVIAGSSTLAPMLEELLEDFSLQGYQGSASLDSIGTMAGFQRFIEGDVDLVSASRPISKEESAKAAALGMDPRGFVVAMDSITVCTGGGIHGDLSLEELARLFTVDTWRQVMPHWPNRPVSKFFPGLASGTSSYMAQILYGDGGRMLLLSPGVQFSEDDHVLVQGLLGDPYSVGFFRYSYYVDQKNSLTCLTVDCMRPEDGEAYPLSRPLYLHIDAADLIPGSPESTFLSYVMDRAMKGALPQGFIAPSKQALEKELARFNQVTGGLNQ